MGLAVLDELLKVSKQHSQVVIAALLSIILIGGFGGGLWINNLESSLAEREALEGQRRAVLQERYNEALSSYSDRVNNVQAELAKLKLIFDRLEPQLTDLSNRMSRLSGGASLSER